MQLKLENPKLFSDLISIISELVTEVRLKVNSAGLQLTAIDPANVAMVHFKIPADLFIQFDVPQEYSLGLNLDNLKAVLRRCKPGSSLTLQKAENFLKLGIHDRIKRDFTLALLDIDAEEKELLNLEFKSVIKMDSEAFAEVVEDCLVVSDACTFFSEPNKFTVEAHGLNSAKAEFSAEEVEIYSDTSKARYSLEYLNKFIKGSKISSRVTISFSDSKPARIDFPTGNVMLSFILAPRIEQED